MDQTNGNHGLPLPREDKIEQTVRLSVQAYRNYLEETNCSYFEFMLQQAKYMDKHWWLFQAFILLGLWCCALKPGGDLYFERCMAVMAPLFVVMAVPELWKNIRNRSMEIEGAAYFSIRQIYAARLTLFGMVDMVLITVFLLAASAALKVSFWNLSVQFLIPFCVSCGICFRILCSRSHLEYTAVLLCFVWTAVWFAVVSQTEFYLAAVGPVWAAILAAAALYAGFCAHRAVKNYRIYWEGNSSWSLE